MEPSGQQHYHRQFSPEMTLDSGKGQHHLNNPVVKQLDLIGSTNSNLSEVGSAGNNNDKLNRHLTNASKLRRKYETLTTQTKCLCAIIIILILIILALVMFDLRHSGNGFENLKQFDRNRFYDNDQSFRYLQARINNSNNNNNNNRAEQLSGKLDTSNADNHFFQVRPPSSSSSSSDDHNDDPSDSSDNDHHDLSDHQHDQENNILPNRQQQLNKNRDSEAICVTPGCIRASAQILQNMDNKTKPCEDFYQFACGRWLETRMIPDEKSSLSVFSENTADLTVKLRVLIERKPTTQDPPIVGQMRNMYYSCMNLTDIEARGDEPLLEMLRYFGGWPVLEQPQSANEIRSPSRRSLQSSSSTTPTSTTTISSADSGFNWLETLIKFRERGFSHDMIIDLSVVPDVRNSRRYIIDLDQSSLGLPDISYYYKGLNDTTVAAYYNLMVESAVMLGASRQEARKQMSEALAFETALAKISVPREQRRNVTRLYNKMPARDLYKLAPNINWQRYLTTLLGDEELDLDRDEVNVKVPSFIRSIDSLLLRTEPRTLANYMLWRVVRHSFNSLSRRWRELSHGYSKVTTGRLSEEPRWEQCLGSLEGTLGSALSALYVKNHFNQQSKVAALEMVDYIRTEFLKILDEIDWMDEETREEAKLKARGISPYIGYPDELLRDELIEEFFSGLSVSRTNFYQNIRNIRIWSTNYAFRQLRKPNKRGDWTKHARAAVVNAFYNSLENSIEFPAGILQGAFFDAERPNYMNFGAIGYIIGHEITHGFDDRGRQFDREGNDRNWWKPKTDARFKERAQCIIEQYGNYTVAENGLRVNGLNTQGENIADNGGIKEAFRAYRRWTKDHGRELRLPGLNYSPDQLFWISAANIWCGKFRPEVLKLRVTSGVHSPARFRIIGPLSNSAEFAQSFNCPLGSPMNPRKKCSVW